MRRFLLAAFLVAAGAGGAGAQAVKVKDTEGLFLDMSKLNLGTITSEDDKKKYIYTIQLEKARVTRKTLRNVYENAFDLYRQGQYEAANELTRKILAIDPSAGCWRTVSRRAWRSTVKDASSRRPSAGRRSPSSLQAT